MSYIQQPLGISADVPQTLSTQQQSSSHSHLDFPLRYQWLAIHSVSYPRTLSYPMIYLCLSLIGSFSNAPFTVLWKWPDSPDRSCNDSISMRDPPWWSTNSPSLWSALPFQLFLSLPSYWPSPLNPNTNSRLQSVHQEHILVTPYCSHCANEEKSVSLKSICPLFIQHCCKAGKKPTEKMNFSFIP